MTFETELEALQKLLEEFDSNSQLVKYTHQILCETYKNQFIKLGQPANKIVDGIEYGPSGEEGFIEIQPWGYKYALKSLVKDVLADVLYKGTEV